MERQHGTRRIVLSAAVVGLAILTVLGGGDAVNAEENSGDNHGSKEQFQKNCEANVIDGVNGTFLDSPKDKLTACFYGDKSKTVCDQNGNNCNYYPPPKSQQEPGGSGPFVGSNGEIITEILPLEAAPTVEETLIGGGAILADIHVIADDTQTVAPVDAPLQTIAEAPLVAAAEPSVAAPVDSQAAPAAEPDVVAAPVEAPVILTEEPMAAEEPMTAEEPMAVEASAEQP